MTAQTSLPLSAAVALLCGLLSACPGQESEDKAAQGAGSSRPSSAPAAPSEGPGSATDGLPEGWPVEGLGLPPGAVPLPDGKLVAGRAFGPGCREWSVEFSYANDWAAAVSHCEAALGPLGWSQVGGGKNKMEPLPRSEAQSKRKHTQGKRVYVSSDELQFLFLYYEARPDVQSQNLLESFKLQAIVFEQPQPITPPSFKETLSP